MKIKKGFILRNVGGQDYVVAVGAASKEFDGLVRLNDSGTLMWKMLLKGADKAALAKALTDTYEVDGATARADAGAFLVKLTDAGILEP